MLCSIIANGNLHVFSVTTTGDLVHGSHAAGTGAFPFDTVTNDCDPKVAPTAQVFNNNLHVFAQKTAGDIVWAVAPHGGAHARGPRPVVGSPVYCHRSSRARASAAAFCEVPIGAMKASSFRACNCAK